MFGQKPFNLITYKKPKSDSRQSEIQRFVGFDTEAYRNGHPFMLCTSDGDVFTPSMIPACLFDMKFKGAHFVLFNMKYDAGAILRCFMSLSEMKKLARYGEVELVRCRVLYRIKYLPHKYLLITKDKIVREFWDISQFYHGSLDRSAEAYLGQRKIKVATKSFNRRYVRKNWRRLCRYCIRDAVLTARLADYFKGKLNEFGISVNALYSAASLSHQYFKEHTGIVDVWKLYDLQPEVLMFAHEAYQGGKFEMTSRGSFTGYEYDIVSAYPNVMRNLVDIRNCEWFRSNKYHSDVPFGFLRCMVYHPYTTVPPCHGILLNGVRVYPTGSYYVTLTKHEYEYLTENDVGVRIIDGWWVVPTTDHRPYRKVIDYLFKIKDNYRKTDKMLYSVTKIMMNGMYGRMANLNSKYEDAEDYPQMTPDEYGEIETFTAGSAWNPIYASVITADTRIAVCKLQKILGPACLATHTDSVITTKQLPEAMLSEKLGGLKLELTGPGLLMGCGMYDMAGHTAYRGFEMPDGFSWAGLLSERPRASKYRYRQLRVVSWTQACAWDRIEETNVFQHLPKQIDLNSDVKRQWNIPKVRGHHLLNGLELSQPRQYTETSNPWR